MVKMSPRVVMKIYAFMNKYFTILRFLNNQLPKIWKVYPDKKCVTDTAKKNGNNFQQPTNNYAPKLNITHAVNIYENTVVTS